MMAQGKAQEFGAIGGVGFAQQAADVLFYRARAEEQAIANLSIRQPIGKQGQHILLAGVRPGPSSMGSGRGDGAEWPSSAA